MALLVCALALFAEAGESAIYRNPMEWPDVVDDALGIAIALGVSALMLRRSGTANPAASEK
jgi:hypothetical protein